MPHPNPPAKQNLDKKGLLTISNSAYCNFTWYMAISSITLPSREVGGGRGRGRGYSYISPLQLLGGGGGRGLQFIHGNKQIIKKGRRSYKSVCVSTCNNCLLHCNNCIVQTICPRTVPCNIRLLIPNLCTSTKISFIIV